MLLLTTHEYGISKKTFDELRESLKGKDIGKEKRDAAVQKWIKPYKELEARLEKRSAEDALTRQVKEKLDEGDMEGAEHLLRESLEKNLKAPAERRKAAASDAYELGYLKELQLSYGEARGYYKQTVKYSLDALSKE